MENLLSQKPCVLLFGIGRETVEFIHALNKDYDIEPYVYAAKRLSIIPGIVRCKYIHLKYPDSKYYLLHTLLDFNDEVRIRQTNILIPGTSHYLQLAIEFKDTLEASFIIANLEEIREYLPTLKQKRR